MPLVSLVSHLNPLLEVANPLSESTQLCVVSVLGIHPSRTNFQSLFKGCERRLGLDKLSFKSWHFYFVLVVGTAVRFQRRRAVRALVDRVERVR